MNRQDAKDAKNGNNHIRSCCHKGNLVLLFLALLASWRFEAVAVVLGVSAVR